MRRRDLLASGRGLLALLVALASAPSLLFWWRSARRRGTAAAKWADLGPLARLPEDGWVSRTVTLERRDRWRVDTTDVAIYVRRAGDRVDALSAVCTHTGCLVRATAAVPGFECPCHRSRFDAEGRSLAGPALRPLDRLETRIVDGVVGVRYEQFRPGLPQKEPIES
jgi:Rieske Fe-S protein